MKKKLMSLLSLILAVIMVFPAAVFAVDPTPNATLYYNSTDASKKTTTLTFDGAETWRSSHPDVAHVTNEGVVTGLSAGTAYIYAGDANSADLAGGQFIIKVEGVALTGISIDESKSKKDYVAGTFITKSDLKVIATYNDGTTNENFTDYSLNITSALTVENQSVTVTATNTAYSDSMGISVKTVTMEDMVKSIAISAPLPNAEYTVGNTIAKSDIKILVTYADDSTATKTLADSGVTCTGIDFTAGGTYNFSNADAEAGTKTITVTYADCSASVTVKVKAAATTPTPDTKIYTYYAEVVTPPTTTSYNVGQTFSPSGMTVKFFRYFYNEENKRVIEELTPTAQSLTTANFVGLTEFTSNDTNKTSFTFTVKANIVTIGEKNYPLTVSNLTVKSKDTRNIKSVDNVVLNNSKYSVGKVFSKEDISYIQVTFVDGARALIRASEFNSYAFMDNSFNLLVLNAQGKDKTTNWATIEQGDILVDTKTGAKSVRLALYYKKYASTTSSNATQGVYAPTTFAVGIDEPDIAFWAGSTMKGEFSDMELALDATVNGHLNLGTSGTPTFSLGATDRVTLVLGKDTSVSKFYSFSPSRYVTIDLNGNDLVFYSDTVTFPANSRYELVITNSSDTPATFTYADKGIELTVTKGNGFAFTYGEELPGFYTVTVTAGSYGKVTASPSLDKNNKVEAPMGSTVELMITPNTGYEVYDVVVEGKSVKDDKDNYSLKENTGVVIYKLTDVSENTEVVVTFQAKKSQWKNPFKDVKETDAYYSAVEFVYTNELFQGTTSTTFAPNNTMTRAMFVTALGRLAGLDDTAAVKEYGYSSDFKDVSASNSRITYAVPYIKWAVENGIIEGYGDGNFGPENPITHQQMYLMMYRYAVYVEHKAVNVSGTTLTGITDRGSVADWAETGVKMAKQYEFLVYTTGSRIEPTAVAKRHELAQLFEKFCLNVLEWEE